LFGSSKLSVWWLRLGINIERIRPGHPQQNGRHERMHLTLKNEAKRPAGSNIFQQQVKFDEFEEKTTANCSLILAKKFSDQTFEVIIMKVA